MSYPKERLHGFVVTHNREKGFGSIAASDGKKYFYFEGESRSFNFRRFNSKALAVTFVAFAPKKIGGDMVARDIESDSAFYEAKAKEHYGSKYRTPEQRRAHRAAKNSSLLVAAE